MNGVEVYSDNLVVAGVCAPNDMDPRMIERTINASRVRPWRIKPNAYFPAQIRGYDDSPEGRGDPIYDGPEAPPVPCPDKPDTHQHWIVWTGP